MNIENIEAFVYINHYGSFNKAAEVLFLSQPSVTARIQSLERELGCKLFDRLGKQIVLTDEGRKFLPYAQQVLQVIQKGKQKIQQRRSTPDALRLGSTVSVSNYVIPDFLPKIKEAYPEINIKLTTATTDQLIAKLLVRRSILLLCARSCILRSVRLLFMKIRSSSMCTKGIHSLRAGMSAWKLSEKSNWSSLMWIIGLATYSQSFRLDWNTRRILHTMWIIRRRRRNLLCKGQVLPFSRSYGEEGSGGAGAVPYSGT